MDGDNAEGRERAHELIRAGRLLYGRGWVPATSGNFSARLSDGRIAITVSGRHKGELEEADIMVVDPEGRATQADLRPSAETLLHTGLYKRFPDVGAVLHPHSLHATLISRLFPAGVELAGYELLKAFSGITTHDTRLVVPVFPNDQDMRRLADQVDAYLDEHEPVSGYLIAGHGLYVWGTTVSEALRHAEAFDFLFECELRMQGLEKR
ncbi:MAG TPA: methylthioribulose 1-phosphate dehydratase [Gammaproteobacteria bacterium]|nr:methylthioribulose 1-phosphate dehydratase [Gammaproteobacteria bacterium]